MSTQVAVVYPSTTSFSGSGQLDLGPFFIPSVIKLLRVEVRGKINFQAVTFDSAGVEANFILWSVQWVPTSTSPNNCVTTADGPQWPIREQIGSQETRMTWAPSTDVSATMAGYAIKAEWAGQVEVGESIDMYMSLRPPTGSSVPNYNLFASLRFWWA